MAYWLFPRHSRERPYGASWLVATAYVALNVGLLRAVAEPAVCWSPSRFWDWGVMVSALVLWAGVLLFVVYIWTRVQDQVADATPQLSARRLALCYLVAGTTASTLMLLGKGSDPWPWVTSLRPLHVEFLLFGWMVQFVIGVATWILPRTRPPRSRRPVVVAGVLLNVGLWCAGLGAMLAGGGWVLLVGRVCESAALAAFALHVWTHVAGSTILTEWIRNGLPQRRQHSQAYV